MRIAGREVSWKSGLGYWHNWPKIASLYAKKETTELPHWRLAPRVISVSTRVVFSHSVSYQTFNNMPRLEWAWRLHFSQLSFALQWQVCRETFHKKVPSGNGIYVFQLISMYVFRHRHSRSGGPASNKFPYIYMNKQNGKIYQVEAICNASGSSFTWRWPISPSCLLFWTSILRRIL